MNLPAKDKKKTESDKKKKQNKTNIYMTVADHGREPKSHHIVRN
jgi:hypothetical protein